MDTTPREKTFANVARWRSSEVVAINWADFTVEDHSSRHDEIEEVEKQSQSQQPKDQHRQSMNSSKPWMPSIWPGREEPKTSTDSQPQQMLENMDPEKVFPVQQPPPPLLPEIEEDEEFDWDDETLPSSRRLSKSSTLVDGLEGGPLLIFTSEGIRKKNARFEIPSERNLENIDALIALTSDEQEKKELMQQKRLLRNRQAALDSRQRKKTHIEKLELERKEWLAEKEELENTLAYFRDRTESLGADWIEQREEYETLLREIKDERDEAIRTKALETTELTGRNNVLEDSVRDLNRQLKALLDTSCTAASDAVTAQFVQTMMKQAASVP